MALLTISGFPCSGKSTRAHQLKDYFNSRLSQDTYDGPSLRVAVIDDEGSHVPRSTYDSSAQEKPGRANLFTAVTRSLGPDTITIVDSANYIKGFRYQMYCAAREAGCRACTIHVVAPPDKCIEWHSNRGECSYKPATFDNLIMRYEEPSSMVRWDSPLFTIPWDEEPPFEDIWNAAIKGEKKPPTSAVVQRSTPGANTLQTLTKTTSSIVTSLLAHLSSLPESTTFPIPSTLTSSSTPKVKGEGNLVLHLPSRRVTLSELQRLKRQYEAVQIKAHSSGGLAAENGWREEDVARGFTRFLEEVWETR